MGIKKSKHTVGEGSAYTSKTLPFLQRTIVCCVSSYLFALGGMLTYFNIFQLYSSKMRRVCGATSIGF